MRRLLAIAFLLLAGVAQAQSQTSPGDHALAVNRIASSAYIWSVPGNVTVANGTTTIEPNFPWASGVITSVDYGTNGTSTPSFTASVQIGGVNVANCSSLSVSATTNTNVGCTGANGLSRGAIITVVIASVSGSPNQAWVKVNFKRSVN